MTALALGILIRNSQNMSYFSVSTYLLVLSRRPLTEAPISSGKLLSNFVRFCKRQLLKSLDTHFISIVLRHFINSCTVVDPPRHSYTQSRASVYMYRYSCDRGQRRDHPSLMHPAPIMNLLNKQCRKMCWYINGICWRFLRLGKIWV